MGEWEKVQATKGAIVGFKSKDHDVDVDVGSLNPVTRCNEYWVEIINNWGCEARIPRGTFEELGGYLAGTQMERPAHD